MKIMDLKFETNNLIEEASRIIRNGGIAILPFDTVYGFACDSRNEKALQKIYELKRRPIQKTVGLAAADIEALKSIAELTNVAEEYITQRSPGRYTFILKKKLGASVSESCLQGCTVGIRIPDSQLILDIAKASGGIIAQTSANISGQPNCFSLDDVKNQYSENDLRAVDLIVDGGQLNIAETSKLIDLTGETPREIERS